MKSGRSPFAERRFDDSGSSMRCSLILKEAWSLLGEMSRLLAESGEALYVWYFCLASLRLLAELLSGLMVSKSSTSSSS